MAFSTQQLRTEFKQDIDFMIDKTSLLQGTETKSLSTEIQGISEHLESIIHEKIQLLVEDFQDFPLTGDYLHTVTESFADLDRLLQTSNTFMDSVFAKPEDKSQNQSENRSENKSENISQNIPQEMLHRDEILQHIKEHYRKTLIPLLNIMAKLENDYISIATQTIQREREALIQIQVILQKLKLIEASTKKSVLVMNKKRKLSDTAVQIKIVDLKRKMLQLSLQNDQFNLYYFNHDHPMELRDTKYHVDRLRQNLRKIKETGYDWYTR